MSAAVDMLSDAQELIRDPQNWCQFAEARNADGREVQFDYKSACQWCAFGATDFAGRGHADETALRAMRALRDASDPWFDTFPEGVSPEAVNDNCGHAAVMEMFDRAIQIAKEAG